MGDSFEDMMQEHNSLVPVVEAAKDAARDSAWKWPAGEEFTFYKVSWHAGGGIFREGWTVFDGTIDGYAHLVEKGRTREMRIEEFHLPMFERFTARCVEDLPEVWRERQVVLIYDIDEAADVYVRQPGATMAAWTGVWEPIQDIREIMDDEVIEIQVGEMAGESALAQAIDRMGMARRVTEIDRLTSGFAAVNVTLHEWQYFAGIGGEE